LRDPVEESDQLGQPLLIGGDPWLYDELRSAYSEGASPPDMTMDGPPATRDQPCYGSDPFYIET